MTVSVADNYVRKFLVAAGTSQLWGDNMAGTLTQITGAAPNTADQLVLFEAHQKVFLVNGAILGVVEFVNTKLTLSALTTAPLKGDTLTQATSGAKMIVDSVSADKTLIYGFTTTTTAFNATNTVSSDNVGGTTMNPATFTPSAKAEASTTPIYHAWTKAPGKVVPLPAKAYLGCLYRGRCVLSGNPNDPHQWYMSRQNDPYDFDYVAGDAQSPVAGANAPAGRVGDIIRSVMPYQDDYLVFGCANSMWILVGDPMENGSLRCLDEHVGIFGHTAWCFDPRKNLWFFGIDGLYKIPAGGGAPQNMTAGVLPKIITDLAAQPSTHRICLGYDPKRSGIVITCTTLATGVCTGFWYDLRTEGFFPESYPTAIGIYSLFNYQSPNSLYSDLLAGCKNGYIGKWSNAAKDDAVGTTTAIDSYCLMPLQQLGEDGDHFGRANSITAWLAGGAAAGVFGDTDNIEYEFHVADDNETLVEDIRDGATALLSGTWAGPGRMKRLRDRVSGNVMGIKIGNNNLGETWALEKIEFDSASKGTL